MASRAAPGQVDLRALFRRAEAAHRDVGHEIVHRHARRHSHRGGQDRSAGAGHGLCAGAEGQRVSRCARARDHGYDHGLEYTEVHADKNSEGFRRQEWPGTNCAILAGCP